MEDPNKDVHTSPTPPVITGEENASLITPPHNTRTSYSDVTKLPPLDANNPVISKIMKTQQPKRTQKNSPKKTNILKNPPPTPSKIDLVDKQLGQLLELLFDEVDLSDPKPHEILQGLSHQGIKSWTSFIWMDEDDIKSLVKPNRHQPTPLSGHSIRMIGHLKQFIWQQMDFDATLGQDISIYNKNNFSAYVNEQNMKKRNHVSNSVNTSGIPSFTPTATKSSGEKKYEAWTKTIGKRSKTSFEQLKSDDQYLIWKPIFDAELAHQKLSHCLDPIFDPSAITCSYEKELWKEQQAYLWTVALQVLKNPLGKASISPHMIDRNARKAFSRHATLQDDSPAKSFSTSISLSTLNEMSIKTHSGSRVDFIADWFEELRRLNELSNDTLSYEMTKGMLLRALQGDEKLPDVFTELQEVNIKLVDIENMKTILLHKASLYDSKDRYLKTGIKAHRTDIVLDINRTAFNSEARLPDHIYSTLDNDDKTAWRQLPEGTRVKFSRLMQARHPAPKTIDRKLYELDVTDNTTQSDLTENTDLVTSIQDLIVQASNSRRTPRSSTSALSATPSDTPPKRNQATTPSSQTSTSAKHKPLLSSMDPAHPASILAKKPVDLYDKAGKCHGYINLCYHRWFTSEDCTDTHEKIVDRNYHVSNGRIANTISNTLIDRGANGSVAGNDCVWLGKAVLPRNVSITGIDNHQLLNIPIGTVGAYTQTNRGPVICIFHQVAYTGRHKSILSSFQLEYHGNDVSDKNPAIGGTGTISTPDGYIFPLAFSGGLPYLKMRKFTAKEWKEYPHVIMTSDCDWDPTICDRDIDFTTYFQQTPDQLHMLPHKDYDLKGEYIRTNTTILTNNHDDLRKQGHIQFTDYIEVDGIPTPAIQSSLETNQHDSQPDFQFWIDSTDYEHSETIARCMKFGLQQYQSIDIYDTNVVSSSKPRIHTPSKRDYTKLKPYFSWLPTKLIEATFKHSTQYGYMPTSPDGNLFKRWQSPNPGMNVFRLNDDLLTDKVYSDKEAIDSGHTEAQIFIGRRSHVIHVEEISKSHPFIKCLQNFVRVWGAPRRLLGDHAGNQASHKVMDYLRLLWIGFWQSEPYYKHQNMFERRYQTFKRTVNRTMDRTGTPPELWFLCMQYTAYVFNRVSDPSLNFRQPIFVATGQIGDISSILPFRWLEPVYYRAEDSHFPSTPTEHFGYWVGISEHVGHAMTFRIWNKTTGKIIDRSAVRTALDPDKQNLRANPDGIPIAPTPGEHHFSSPPPSPLPSDTVFDDGEITTSEQPTGRPPGVIYSINREGLRDTTEYAEAAYITEDADPSDYLSPTPTATVDDKATYVVLNDDNGQPKIDHEGKPILIKGIDRETLNGKTFLKSEIDGTKNRVRVMDIVEDQQKKIEEFTKFKIKYDRTDVEDIMTYNEIMNFIYRDQCANPEYVWKYRKILSHQGPLNRRHPGWNGDRYNIEIEWENGEITFEPFQTIYADDPVALSIYARDNNLLDLEGWRRLKPYARRQKKLNRLIKQAKLKSFRNAPKYMYGYQVPRTYEEALEIDQKNNNTKWADATSLEMEQLFDYNTFRDLGLFHTSKIPTGFQRIKVHLVFAVKHDGRHKSRLVSRGDLTDIPIDSVYAGVVSLRGLRMCIFIAELNNMEAYATDIGNAYLEAITKEKVCIRAGPEFGDKEGHLLIIYKALYGLRSSGKEFGDLLASCLKELGFFPSKAEAEIFMREKDGVYEYVATYVDDLCLVMKDPESFLKILQSKPYSFKLKGSGPMSFHLGCGFDRDKDGILRMNPRKYIDKMMQTYEQLYGNKPSTTPQSPLVENDHPELDTSEFLDEEGMQQYQSLIGSLQWAISIGRWDIQTAIMSLSSFRAQPRKGHLERVKRVYGYLYRFKHFDIKFRIDEPDMTYFDNKTNYDWSKSIYGDHPEEVPSDVPTPLGRKVTLIHYFDANLMHDILSGKAVTGCVHLANKTPIMWYSKKQSTSETATFGAEFTAGRTCMEQIVDLRHTFRYLGIPVHNISYVFGDNETMIQSSSFPYARLHKRHNILSYHYVRSLIARGFIALHHIKSSNNLADVLTKHWSHSSVYNLLRPIFHHTGNTAALYTDDNPECLDNKVTNTLTKESMILE